MRVIEIVLSVFSVCGLTIQGIVLVEKIAKTDSKMNRYADFISSIALTAIEMGLTVLNLLTGDKSFAFFSLAMSYGWLFNAMLAGFYLKNDETAGEEKNNPYVKSFLDSSKDDIYY